MSKNHFYRTRLSWTGTTGVGYEHYDRTHVVEAIPATRGLTLTSDPAFGGNAELLNPEQLLLMAASSCQMLSFLAIAARSRLDVVAYEDEAEAVMPSDERPMRITRIDLRPVVRVVAPAVPDRVVQQLEQAHRECFIANSLRVDIVITPSVEVVDG